MTSSVIATWPLRPAYVDSCLTQIGLERNDKGSHAYLTYYLYYQYCDHDAPQIAYCCLMLARCLSESYVGTLRRKTMANEIRRLARGVASLHFISTDIPPLSLRPGSPKGRGHIQHLQHPSDRLQHPPQFVRKISRQTFNILNIRRIDFNILFEIHCIM